MLFIAVSFALISIRGLTSRRKEMVKPSDPEEATHDIVWILLLPPYIDPAHEGLIAPIVGVKVADTKEAES